MTGDGRGGPESCTWPLLAVVVAVLLQAVVPGRYRVGPPLVVPVVETVALLVLLLIVARPGPVPRNARSAVLVLFGLLVAGLAEAGWQPRFGDHLSVAFTNLVAFSPTDTLALTRRAMGLMALQSLISLGVLVVVLARVVNILPG